MRTAVDVIIINNIRNSLDLGMERILIHTLDVYGKKCTLFKYQELDLYKESKHVANLR